MKSGKIIKGYASFYYVKIDGQLLECKLRGKLRLSQTQILVGDEVTVEIKGGKGTIKDILPRTSELVRPAIANVDLALIVFSFAQPDPVFELLDRILLAVEYAGIKPLVVFTKADLADDVVLNRLQAYRDAGYEIIITSIKQGLGISEILEHLDNKTSVIAGPSGAGKSTLLNALQPGLTLKTGEVSSKIGRGKHTTRHVELIPFLNNGYVADTPGFSVIYLPDMKPVELAKYFQEFQLYFGNCRFAGCLHQTEPQCAVRDAVDNGLVDQGRYERYLNFLQQLMEKERTYYD